MNALNKYPWNKTQPFKALSLIDAVKMFSTACQETYPYRFEDVQSNDILYGSDENFITEICNMTGTLISLIGEHISYFDETHNLEAANRIRVEVFFTIINFCELESLPDVASLAVDIGKQIASCSSLSKKDRDMFNRCCSWYQKTNKNKVARKIMSSIMK